MFQSCSPAKSHETTATHALVISQPLSCFSAVFWPLCEDRRNKALLYCRCLTLKNRWLRPLVHMWVDPNSAETDDRHEGTQELIHHAHNHLWFGLLTSVANWPTFALQEKSAECCVLLFGFQKHFPITWVYCTEKNSLVEGNNVGLRKTENERIWVCVHK